MSDKTLEQLYREHSGKVSDKWQLYLLEYDRLFSTYRSKPVQLLEIGVQNGGSLEIWAQFFTHAKAIVGCDIDPGCAKLDFADERISVVVGNVNSLETRAQILERSADFDILIDDGSHTSSDVIKSFAMYFPHLAKGGIYIVEDLHCSYWHEFEGGLFHPQSSMSFFKALADIVNFKFWGVERSRQDIFKGFFSKYKLKLQDSDLEQIHSIEFSNSICVVKKSACELNQLGTRVISGTTELVAKGHLELPDLQQVDMKSQEKNIWATRKLPPADELELRLQEIARQATQMAELEQRLIKSDEKVQELSQQAKLQNVLVQELGQVVDSHKAHELELGQKIEFLSAREMELQQVADSRKALIQELRQVVDSHKARELELGQKIEFLNARELELQLVADSRNVRVQELRKTLHLQNARELQLRREVDLRNAQIACFYRSRSWRFTAPLRAIWKSFNFNERYYLEQNPDVKADGIDPYEHYMTFGQIEGRRPGPPSFLSQFYRLFNKFWSVFRTEGEVFRSAEAAKSAQQNAGSMGTTARLGATLPVSERNNYAEWIQKYDTLNEGHRIAIKEQISRMPHEPLISIVMPTFNTKIEWLREAIDSVRGQLYENWELCIADDASTESEVREFLEMVSTSDERIKVTFRLENGHISKASNTALDMCTGDWVALLDHDDMLAEHALFCVAEVINHNQELKLIYSDEDKIRENGERWEPYFKCDWNRDLFYSQNMISHLGVYRRNLLTEIGGFRVGFEGSQDYDLALRYIEKIDQQEIYHIPRVLYHWRAHAESTASRTDAKPYALIAGERAIQEHLDRSEIPAKVERLESGYRIHYELPALLPMVSLIIPTRNALHLLSTCIESILEKTNYKNFEIIVVDNGSDEPEVIEYFGRLEQIGNIRIIRDDKPFNYSRINNLAVNEARGELVGFINNDIEVITPQWLDELVSICLQPGVGAVGAKLLYPDDTLQHAGVVLGIGGVANHAFKYQPASYKGYFSRAALISSYSALTAACLLIKKEIFLQVGGFDAENLPVAFSDVDLCLRVIEAGYRNVWTPYSLLYHHESATRGEDNTAEKHARFSAEVGYMNSRWGDLLCDDPAYNPNLTLAAQDFSLAWPPRVKTLDSHSVQAEVTV